jgi:hypothetical protein
MCFVIQVTKSSIASAAAGAAAAAAACNNNLQEAAATLMSIRAWTDPAAHAVALGAGLWIGSHLGFMAVEAAAEAEAEARARAFPWEPY